VLAESPAPTPPIAHAPDTCFAQLRRDVAATITGIIDCINTRVNVNMQAIKTEHQTLVVALGVVITEFKATQQQSTQTALEAAEARIRAALQTEFNAALRERDANSRDFAMHMEAERARLQASIDTSNGQIAQLLINQRAMDAQAAQRASEMQALLTRLTAVEKAMQQATEKATQQATEKAIEHKPKPQLTISIPKRTFEDLEQPHFVEWAEQNWKQLVFHANKDEFVWISDMQEALATRYHTKFPHMSRHTEHTRLNADSIKRHMMHHFGVLSEYIKDVDAKKRKPEEGFKAFIMVAPHEPSPWTKKQLRKATPAARL
jgi:hypothetical protein